MLTIMMLEWFSPGQLPAGARYNRAPTDVSTYRDIWIAAKSIETMCTVSRSPGWLMTGESFSQHWSGELADLVGNVKAKTLRWEYLYGLQIRTSTR